MMEISCLDCGVAYPDRLLPYCCPRCGGLFDFNTTFPFSPSKLDRHQPGIWRYRHSFGLKENSEPVSLGEGNSPLVWVDILNRRVAFKCEFLNPSGSFKDRGSALITAWLRSRGIFEAVEDSSGNAGASLAAYAARAGIKVRIFVNDSTSGPKRRQIEAYGADLMPIAGTRTDVANTVKMVADAGAVYASHAYLPFNLPGYATIAYELFEELGNKMPGAVIVPVGQGGLFLGIKRGFDALRIAYRMRNEVPRIIGVQAGGCAPIWKMYSSGVVDEQDANESYSLAEGVQVRFPVRINSILQAVNTNKSAIWLADEDNILAARNILARIGFYVEPTSAIVWTALERLIQELPDPVVLILTGSGFKYE
jgi:threonine synthase